jgi:MFS family permease
MLTLLKKLFAPLSSLAILIMGNGLLNTFTPLKLEMQGYNAKEIGMVASFLYLGILISSLWVSNWIAKAGHVKAFKVFTLLLSASTYAQSFWIDIAYWSFLRFLSGISLGALFIVIESWLLMQSPPHLRGAVLSIYVIVFYGALSLGQFLLNVFNPMTIVPLFLITALFLISILPILFTKGVSPALAPHTRLSIGELFQISPLGFLGSVVSGIVLATVNGLFPVYAKETGMDLSQIAFFMAIVIFGGFSLQWPLGALADKTNRKQVLNSVCLSTALLAILMTQASTLFARFTLVFLFGGVSFTIYPLSMAYACEKVKEEHVIAVTGGFVLSYGIGAVLGPALAPFSMQAFGPSGLFFFLALICFTLSLFGFTTRKL